ncbi:MAG: DUF4238 domain-containing protein [Bacteroidaceae bacterium]|nr:DUF4238 domain-containing protein [Bacteroidaceae bacterium]
MAKDRKHHFVPVCYLNHFKQNGHIHYYSKERRDTNYCTVDAVCQLPYFNLITQKSWWKTFEIEKGLFNKMVETPLAPMIINIESSIKKSLADNNSIAKFNLTEGARYSLASMIVIQLLRTPRFRKFYEGKKLLRMGISSVTHEFTKEEVTDPVLVHALSTYLNPQKLKKMASYLAGGQWVFRYSEEPVFLTSDNPVVWIPLKGSKQERFTIGNIDDSKCFLYYPITPNIVLEIYDKDTKSLPSDYDNLVLRADTERIAGINLNTIINAEDIVILLDKDINAYSIDVTLKII